MNSSHRVISTLLAGLGALALAYATHAADSAAAVEKEELEEVMVTGSRVITNGNDSPNPVTIVTLEDLQASHPTTVFEALEELPQFSAGRGGALGGNTGQGGNNNSIAGLNLRALGSVRGLILFDGHRVPAQNLDGQVDVNQLPQMMLQRVDVQTGGASAVYGSDAITGVVNFITDRKFNGIKANAQAGISDYHDNRSNEIALAMGHDLFSGRGHIEGSVQSHYDAGLFRQARSYVQAPGMSTWSIAGNGTAATPYFLTQNSRDSSQTYGGVIVCPIAANTASGFNGRPAPTACPTRPLVGQNFASNGILSPFINGSTVGLAGGGSAQIGGDGGVVNQNVTLKTPLDLVQLFARFDFDLTDNLHFFAASFYNIGHQFSTLADLRSGASATTRLGSGFVMSVDNAFLPAAYRQSLVAGGATTFNVGKIFDDATYGTATYDFHSHNFYLNTGLEGKFGQGWRWEASATRSQAVQANTGNRSFSTGRLFAALDAVVSPATGQPVCQVSLTQYANLYPGCVPLNIFGPSATTQAQWDYLLKPTRYVPTTDETGIEGYVSGAPFNSWAGPVNMALSAEWRKLEYLFVSYGEPQNVDPLDCTPFAGRPANCVSPSATDAGTSKTYANGTAGTPLGKAVNQTVKEVALEADFPVLKDLRFARDVGVNLAARYAGYSSTGTEAATIPTTTVDYSANTWKTGLDWHINDALTVRATRSRDFRGPNLGDLFLPGRVQGFTLALDRLTGAQQVLTQGLTGGNPGVKPEVGYTTTVGFVIKPSDAFSLAVDAYDIAITNAITSINGSDANYQDACYASGGASAFCSLQVRPLGSYTNTSLANTATLWFQSAPFNVATIRSQGVDVESNLKLHLMGRPLQLRALVTYQPHIWTEQPQAITLDSGGVSSARVRALVSARFSPTESFDVDWTTRWRSQLRNVDPRVTANFVVDGSDTVASVMYSNANFTYHVPQFTRGKLDAYLNVLNVFNQIPPVYVPQGGGTLFGQVAGGGGVGYYPADDAIGRYFNLGVRLRL